MAISHCSKRILVIRDYFFFFLNHTIHNKVFRYEYDAMLCNRRRPALVFYFNRTLRAGSPRRGESRFRRRCWRFSIGLRFYNFSIFLPTKTTRAKAIRIIRLGQSAGCRVFKRVPGEPGQSFAFDRVPFLIKRSMVPVKEKKKHVKRSESRTKVRGGFDFRGDFRHPKRVIRYAINGNVTFFFFFYLLIFQRHR